jgi:TM2 domain-containing membrane protein YozV
MILKVQFIFLLTVTLLSRSVSQYYTANSDVYFRKGPSTSYEVLDVIKAGDTIVLIEGTSTTWAKINFNGNEGYASLRFFERIPVLEEKEENVTLSEPAKSEGSNTFFNFWFVWFILGGLISTLIYFGGRGNRNKTLAVLLSLFTGFMGLQKFYLGKIFPGLFSLLFFWTFIPLLIGFWDTIKLALMNEHSFQLKYNEIPQKTPKSKLPKEEKEKPTRKKYTTALSDNNSIPYSISNSEGNKSRMVVETKKPLEAADDKITDKISLDLNERKVRENPLPKSDFSIGIHEATNIKSNQNGNYNFSRGYPHISEEKNKSKQVQSDNVNKDFDSGIIDIINEDLDIQIPDSGPLSEPSSAKSTISNVPYWNQFYVYSYEDISRANYAQKRFYNQFRSRMLNGLVTDIDGNTNYAFILYFDFLREFEVHQDVIKLENQLKLLGKCCSRTRNYSLNSLIEILRKRNDEYSINRVEKLQDPYTRYELGFSDYDPFTYRLGRRYKEKLDLTGEEEAWLNKFQNPSNVFNSIEGCCIIIIRLFLDTLTSLEEELKSEGVELDSEIGILKDQVKSKKSSYNNVYDFNYMEERVQEEIFLTFFRRAENAVRENLYHKRKISEDFSITEKQLNVQFEERLGNKFNEILNQNNNSIPEPDLPTKIALNSQNVNRWKVEFEKIASHLKRKDKVKFISEVEELEIANQKNPNIENIFFEASKAIAKQDKTKALEYYVKYIHYDINSDKIHNRKLTKTVQKSLFNDKEQLNEFEKIIQQLIYNKNLDDALTAVKEFYKPKRKKIVLNKKEIEDVKKKHNTTVDILSGYLEDKESVGEEDSEEVEMSFTNERGSNDSIFIDSLSLNILQEELIIRIAQNGFSIQQQQVEEIALKHGQLKNQLIDGINDGCSDSLEGEFLIEEDEDFYIIEESFYEDLIKKH